MNDVKVETVSKVVKRDGTVVDFDRSKIVIAITKANNAVDEQCRISDTSINNIADSIANSTKDYLNVEDIQDMVEDHLMTMGRFKLAKAYITYRYKRGLIRQSNTTDASILSLVRNTNRELKEENANKNTALVSTQRDYIAGEVSRDITRRLLLPEHITKAHDEGILHFHKSIVA